MIDPRKTGARISNLRKQRDWTQSQLAEQLSVTHQAVSRWELGVTFPDLAILVHIAKVFDVKVDDLLNGEATSPGGTASDEAQSQPFNEMVDRLAAGNVEEAARLIQKQPEQVEAFIELAPLAPPSLVKGVITHMPEFQFQSQTHRGAGPIPRFGNAADDGRAGQQRKAGQECPGGDCPIFKGRRLWTGSPTR